MPIRFINQTSGLNVEVMRRPIRPDNIVKRPKITKRNSQGREVKTMMKAKVLTGRNEEDGSPIYTHLISLCPACPPDNPLKDCPFCHGRGVTYLHTNYEKVETVAGEEISDEEEITYFIVHEDGTEEKTDVFDRSDAYFINMEIPKSKLNEFYIENWDEIESPSKKKKGERVHDKFVEQALYGEAERYVVENIMGVGRFVKAKGFKEWFFVTFPYIRDDGQFGWLVGYFQCKIELKHSMPIPAGKEIEAEKKTPAKSYLPQLEALVT